MTKNIMLRFYRNIINDVQEMMKEDLITEETTVGDLLKIALLEIKEIELYD